MTPGQILACIMIAFVMGAVIGAEILLIWDDTKDAP